MYLSDVCLAFCRFGMILMGAGGCKMQGNSSKKPLFPPFPHRWCWAYPAILEKLWLLFYRPFFMARPVVLSFRWTFAPSYYYVFHCLASCLRPIGFPTGGINKDNPIADSISSPTWLVATSRRSAGTKICKKPCLVFLFFHPSCEKKIHLWH